MHIERLRLVGFKSFVEATELAIEPGLTGIVGPNGCGKSNLVEALRWVMGEGSARRLRGGEMDELIFAGTAARPPRNIAEVALTIDNSARDAPFAFNDREEIEIVRRIERGSGSDLPGQRTRGAGARRPAAVRRRSERRTFGRDGEPGPDQRADRRKAGRAAAAARGGRRHGRASCAPPRDRAEARRGGGKPGAARRCRGDDRGSVRHLEESRPARRSATAGLPSRCGAPRRCCSTPAGGPRKRRPNAAPVSFVRLSAPSPRRPRARLSPKARPRSGRSGPAAIASGRCRGSGRAAAPDPSPQRARTGAAAGPGRAQRGRDGGLAQLAADLRTRGGAFCRGGSRRSPGCRTSAGGSRGPRPSTARLGSWRRPACAQAGRAPRRGRGGAAGARPRPPPQAEARRAAIDRRRKELAERRARLEARRAEAERQRASLAAALVAPEAVAAAAAACAEAEQQVGQCRASIEAGEAEIATRLADEQAALDAAPGGRCPADPAHGRGRGSAGAARPGAKWRMPARRSCPRCASPQGSRRRSARPSRTSCWRRSPRPADRLPRGFGSISRERSRAASLPAGARSAGRSRDARRPRLPAASHRPAGSRARRRAARCSPASRPASGWSIARGGCGAGTGSSRYGGAAVSGGRAFAAQKPARRA